MKRRTLLEKLKIKEIRISENRPLINNFSLEITFLSFLKTNFDIKRPQSNKLL